MDYPVKNDTELAFIVRNYIFKKAWVKKIESLRLKNKTDKAYKKIEWGEKGITSSSEIKKCFPIGTALPSWLKLVKDKVIRKLKRTKTEGYRYPAIDVKEELLRREIACQEDDLFWTKVKVFNSIKRDSHGKIMDSKVSLTKAQKRKLKRREQRKKAKENQETYNK